MASSPTVIYVSQCYYPSCPEERLDDIGSLITSLVTRSHINSKCLQWLKQWSLNSVITFSIFTCVRLCTAPQKYFFLSPRAVFAAARGRALDLEKAVNKSLTGRHLFSSTTV